MLPQFLNFITGVNDTNHMIHALQHCERGLASLMICITLVYLMCCVFLLQVTTVCQRMLKEREEQIREDYDKVLASKLAGEVSISLCVL